MPGSARKRTRGRLTSRQDSALRVLLGGGSITEAAKEAGVRRATVSGWVNAANGDSSFRDELARQQGDLRKAVRSRLECSAGEAINVLRDLLHDANARTRLQASKSLLALVADLTAGEGPRVPGGLPQPELTYTGEAERKRWEELTKFTPGERETMRQLWEHLVEGARKIEQAKERLRSTA